MPRAFVVNNGDLELIGAVALFLVGLWGLMSFRLRIINAYSRRLRIQIETKLSTAQGQKQFGGLVRIWSILATAILVAAAFFPYIPAAQRPGTFGILFAAFLVVHVILIGRILM